MSHFELGRHHGIDVRGFPTGSVVQLCGSRLVPPKPIGNAVNLSEERRDARRVIAFFAAGLFAVSTLACSDPLVFADWTIPVAEGTRVVEYPAVPDEDRAGHRIELAEELVIRGGDDDASSFYQPFGVLIDDAGRTYIVDLGETRIQVYDDDGDYVRSLGGEGSGPGEFRGTQGGWVTIIATLAGEHVVAYDMQQSRISVWNMAGEHVRDRILDEFRLRSLLGGDGNTGFVGVTMARSDAGSEEAVVAVDFEGQLDRTYVSLPRPENLNFGVVTTSDPSGGPAFAAAKDGTVYASAGDEYQVLAVGTGGEQRWALRVAHQRLPLTDDDRARILDRLSMDGTHEVDDSNVNWPSHIGSISRLAVDGHGHLYVFAAEPPYVDESPDIDVDVYGADGERLFAGTMPRISWSEAAADYVVALRRNRQTEEREAVRYRLVEPF